MKDYKDFARKLKEITDKHGFKILDDSLKISSVMNDCMSKDIVISQRGCQKSS